MNEMIIQEYWDAINELCAAYDAFNWSSQENFEETNEALTIAHMRVNLAIKRAKRFNVQLPVEIIEYSSVV